MPEANPKTDTHAQMGISNSADTFYKDRREAEKLQRRIQQKDVDRLFEKFNYQ